MVFKSYALRYGALQPRGFSIVTAVCEPAPSSNSRSPLGGLIGRNDANRSDSIDARDFFQRGLPLLPTGHAVGTNVTFRGYGALPPSRKRWDENGGTLARAMDVVLAAALIVFLFPVLVMVALLVFLTEPGPVLFAHKRQGRNGRPFDCLKFRSMVLDAERELQKLLVRDPAAREEWDRDHKLRNDPRITRIGNFLRRSSLDELPQLFNVLRGDMSLVGPRPIVEAEVLRYGRYIDHYYQIRPGITGLWQVSGRNNTSYRRRVALDVIYARHRSATLNIRILMMTLPSVLRSRGAF